MAASGSDRRWWPWFNMTDPRSVDLQDYREWYSHYGSLLGSNISDCNIEREMNKVEYGFKGRLAFSHIHLNGLILLHRHLI